MNQSQTIILYQPMLESIAMKMLRCKADAEDLVQETFINWLSIDQEKIKNTKAYLIGAITNTCINHLNSLKKKKEAYIESFHWKEIKGWFKEPDFSHMDVEAELSSAFSIVLGKLEPLERIVFLLKEIFNLEYEELQVVLEKKQEHCRQLLCRARKKLKEESEKFNQSIPSKDELFASFRKACNLGDVNEFIAELKKDLSNSLSKIK